MYLLMATGLPALSSKKSSSGSRRSTRCAISTAPVTLRPGDVSRLDSLAALIRRYPRLHLELTAGPDARERDVDSLAALVRKANGATDSSAVGIVRSTSGSRISGRIIAR